MRKLITCLLLSSFALAGVFVITCGKGTNDKPASSLEISSRSIDISTETQDLSTEEIQTAEERGRRARELAESLRPYMVDANIEDIAINWNYSDNIKFLWGEGFKVSLASMGCSTSDLKSGLVCFLGKFKDWFGIELPGADLRFVRSVPLKHGYSVYRFRQYEGGLPVQGADVILTTDSDANVTRFYSRYVSGLQLKVPAGQTAEALANAADRQWLAGVAGERLGITDPIVTEELALVYVDFAAQSMEGTPAIQLTIQTRPDYLMDVTIALPEGNVLRIEPRTVEVEYAAKQKNYTGVAYEAFTNTNCTPFGPGYFCGSPYSCSYDTDPYKCENKCTTDSECSLVYTGWKCWPSNLTFPNYCYKDEYNQNAQYLYIYDRDHWMQSVYSYHKRYTDLLTKMNDVISFHYDQDEGLGRLSWNGANADYSTYLTSFCSCDVQPCSYGENCPLGSTNGVGNVYYHMWFHLAPEDNVTLHNEMAYHTLSHEWAHDIIRAETGTFLSYDCLSENIPDMYGSLLGVKKIGGSSTNWETTCLNGNSYFQSAWQDETSGINPGCTSLPYALRSRFDWYCNENTYLNSFIWERFIRVLSEGTSTFQNDGNDEQVGVSFTGIGLSETIDVVYEATVNLASSTNLEDWLGLINSAGVTHVVSDRVHKALGIVGFIKDGNRPTESETNKAPYQYHFAGWTLSTDKRFIAWKDRATYNIKVLYNNGSNWVTDTISANTDSAPAMVVYNNRLHIFWRDRSSSAIKFMYYRYDGVTYGPYDLSSLGITTVGSFDGAVFNNYLYIVYSVGASKDVYLSKCSSATGCSTATWYNFGGYTYKKSLGYTAYPGMGVDMGSDINGTGPTNYLYIAAASTLAGYNYRIRIDQVGADDNRRHTGFVVWVPNTYPSYLSVAEIGLKAVTSAFVSAKTYLYLAWKDFGTTNVYMAVVQKYDDVDNSDTQITKSADTFLDSNTGLRIQKGDGASTDKTVISSTETTYVIIAYYLWGRY